MTPHGLEESWRKTTEYLRDARSHLPEAAEGICHDEIAQFEEFLEHNELELALDSLEVALLKFEHKNLRVLELMTQAALNMGLEQHAARYRATIIETERAIEERWQKRSQDDNV